MEITVSVLETASGRVVCERCVVAKSFWARLRGLQFRPPLQPNEGLLIARCPSVHMIGVRFAIDVIFLDTNCRITDRVENLPGGFHFYVAKARQDLGRPDSALELPAGSIARCGLGIGDQLCLEP